MEKTIYRYFIDKYLMPNPEWCPFGDLAYDLSFIPVQFHSMFTRVSEWEEELSFEDLYGCVESAELPF